MRALKKNNIVCFEIIRWYAKFFLLVWWYAVDKRLGTPDLEHIAYTTSYYNVLTLKTYNNLETPIINN